MKKPTTKTVTKALSDGAGAGVGLMVSRVSDSYYPQKKLTSGIAKAATSLVSIFGASSVTGTGHLESATRTGLLTFGIDKFLSGLGDILVDQGVIASTPEDSPAKKMLMTAMSIKPCACAATPEGRLILPALNQAYNPQFPVLNMQQNAQGTFTAEQFI